MISLYRHPRLPQQRSDSNEVAMRVSQASIVSPGLVDASYRAIVPSIARDFEEETLHVALSTSASER